MGSGAPNYVDNAIWELLQSLSWGSWTGLPIGNGRVFFVDGLNGLDTNVGTRPDQPFLTVTHALTQCVADRNDYIIVLDHWQEVINLNVTRVHLIGLSNYLRPNSNHSFVQMNAAADTAIIQLTTLSNNCEIAGFSFGGGATHAGIENAGGTPMGVHIHDCVFGHSFAGGTPRDGILIGNNATNIRIDHNVFLGAPGGKGTLTRDGIRWSCGGDPLNGYIGENEFKALPGIGVHFNVVAAATGGITIKDNIFSCGGDVQGSAITLRATTRGFLVMGNRALYGPTTGAMVQNPYLDETTVAPWNAWAENYKGNVLIDPA